MSDKTNLDRAREALQAYDRVLSENTGQDPEQRWRNAEVLALGAIGHALVALAGGGAQNGSKYGSASW